MNIYSGGNYKNYTLSLWVAQTSVYEKAMRFLKMLKRKTEKTGTEKAYLSSFIYHQTNSYAPTFHHDARRAFTVLKTLE